MLYIVSAKSGGIGLVFELTGLMMLLSVDTLVFLQILGTLE
jgi:hypothetical protein